MTGISAIGTYTPRFRITAEEFSDAWGQFQASGVNQKAVAAADEDALTMAYEAATRALEVGDVDPESIDWLGFGTSRPPVAEEDLTARLGAMIALESGTTRHVFTSSTRAGTRALWAGMDAVQAGAERALIVAADAPRGEPDDAIDHAAGAGAAAFVLEHDGPARIVDRAEYARAFPGTRFRESGSETIDELGVTQYDRHAFTETIGGAVDGLEETWSPSAAAIQAPDGKLPYRSSGPAGVETDDIRAAATVHDLGDLGAASVPISVAKALDNGYETILAVSHGSGAGADAFVIENPSEVPTTLDLGGETPLSYAAYLRQRGVVTSGPPSGGGAYVSVPAWQRSIPQRYRREAGRCPECGSLEFPPEGACRSCNFLGEYDPVQLPREGTIEAVTTISQGGAPPEFAEQQAQSGDYAAAIVAFEVGGERVCLPAMGTDADPSTLEVGDRVETTIRRIYTQEGVTRYGFKIRPLETA
ncbi:ACP synthase [Halostagnicola bangensis]